MSEKEVGLIVDSLRKAFGLELFDFDVLMTNDNVSEQHQPDQQRRQMSVADVKYFPSYKELPNIPGLLVKYLTDRVIACRRKTTQQ